MTVLPPPFDRLAPATLATKVGRYVVHRYILWRLSKENPPHECWLLWIIKIHGRMVLLRRNETARRMVGDKSLMFCTRVDTVFASDDPEGIANNDGPALDDLEIRLRRALCTDQQGVYVASLTYESHRIFVFYCSRPWSKSGLLRELPTDFAESRIQVECSRDEHWSIFRAIA